LDILTRDLVLKEGLKLERNSKIKLIENLWGEFELIDNQIYLGSIGTLEIWFKKFDLEALLLIYSLWYGHSNPIG
jgi:hypothetical protein